MIILIFCANETHAQAWEEYGNNASQSSYLGTNNDVPLHIKSNSYDRMFIHGTNNTRATIGIGTTHPNYSLHIHCSEPTPYYIQPPHGIVDYNPDNGSEAMVQFTNNETGENPGNGLKVGVSGNRCLIVCEDKLQMMFKNVDAQMMLNAEGTIDFFQPSGWNSTAKLRLNPGSSDGFSILKMSGDNTYGLQVRTTASTSVNAIEVKQNSNIEFVIKNNGRTGIGTSTPDAAYMLDVVGKIRSCEVRVNNVNGWCDYVFAKDYALMPLSKLATYIDTHHHLLPLHLFQRFYFPQSRIEYE